MSEAKVIEIRSLIKFFILILLYSSDYHGYKLMKDLEKILNKKISSSHVYPFLNELILNGYLEIKEKGIKNKKVYSLTDKGRKFAEFMIFRMGNILESFLRKNIKVCHNCGCKIYEGGYTLKENGKYLYFCCIHCARNYKHE
jgi:DNA-binding PadR family transcriptional regulator